MADPDIVSRIDAWPPGTRRGTAQGRDWTVSKSVFANGKSVKMVAHELGGNGYISLNLYHLAGGARIYPCEMSVDTVTDFLTDLAPAV